MKTLMTMLVVLGLAGMANAEFTIGGLSWMNFLSRIVNLHPRIQDIWERFCWVFLMDQIQFTLEVIK